MSIRVAVIQKAAWRQLIVNGDFTADTNWNKGTGWTISGGKGVGTVATGNLVAAVDPLVSSTLYRTYIIVTATVGKIVLVCGTQVGTARGAGSFTEDITANGAGFYIRPATIGEGGTGNFTGTVDAVYAVPLKEPFTKSGYGTAKAAMFFIAQAFTDGTTQADASTGMGMADGTRQYCAMGSSRSGQASSDSYRRFSNSSCIGYISQSTGAILSDARWESWVTDGVQIQWNIIDAPSSPPLMTAVVFYDDSADLKFYAGDVTTSGAEDGTVDVTAPGFQPDQLFVISIGDTTAWDTTGNGLKLCFGMVDNAGGGSVTNISHDMISTDAVGSSDVRNHVSTQYAIKVPGTGAKPTVLIDTFAANGFTANTIGLGGSCVFAYLALGYGGKCNHWAGVLDSPTASPGNIAVTTPGFKPQAVVQCPVATTTVDADVLGDSTGAGSWSTAAFDATAASSVNIRDKDAVSPTATENLIESKPVRNWSGAGSAIHTATFTSFDATGWTLNYSVTNATVRKWPALAIGEFIAATKVKDPIGCGVIPFAR